MITRRNLGEQEVPRLLPRKSFFISLVKNCLPAIVFAYNFVVENKRGKSIYNHVVDKRGNHFMSLPVQEDRHSIATLSSENIFDNEFVSCQKNHALNEEKGKGICVRQDEEEQRGMLFFDF